MNLLIFGRDILVQRIKTILQESGVNVITASLEMLSRFTAPDAWDLAIIDMGFENAEEACQIIKKNRNLPLVLIVKHRQADWSYLDSLNASGYIFDNFNKNELIARLSAIFRRYHIDASELMQAN